MGKSNMPDAFEKDREEKGYREMDDQNDPVTMILRHKDVRKAAHNWKTYQSGAVPGRIVVPSEVDIRDLRQIPFEVDPPEHKAYRDLIDAWFKRPLEADYQKQLSAIIGGVLDEAIEKGSMEVIHEFSLPLQSRALTVLLNSSMDDAERWISWGTHVFRSDDDPLDGSKANVLADFLDERVEERKANPTEDLFSVLLDSEVDGRKLTDDEVKGVMMLTFAGGRDTVINAVTNSLAYFADHTESLEFLRKQPEHMTTAIEELVRYFSPLTHMGRVATADSSVCEHAVKNDTRVSLCWASANRDAKVFDRPNEVVLDRQVNPHVGFGFGTHNCLGATHARTILKILLEQLVAKISTMEIVDATENMEDLDGVERKVGYKNITIKFNGI